MCGAADEYVFEPALGTMASYTGGAREDALIRKLEDDRVARRAETERQRGLIASASGAGGAAGRGFASGKDAVVDLLKTDTVGLVTHEDFKARREYLERSTADEFERRGKERRRIEAAERRGRLGKGDAGKLSFGGGETDGSSSSGSSGEEEAKSEGGGRWRDREGGDGRECDEGEEEPSPKRRRVSKNPDADVEFLPDRDREVAEEAERVRLKQEWVNEQERRKAELVNITYSYWDGAGHRRTIRCKKATTVGRFLGMVQTQFKELRNVSSDELVFVKEDLIIPHHYSFYDFIVSKARGKSGPLFSFDVVEDVRVVSDANKEKTDAHAAKVVERRWYERNRHIFPASRWTTFDPKKKVSIYEYFTQPTNWLGWLRNMRSALRFLRCPQCSFLSYRTSSYLDSMASTRYTVAKTN